MKILTRIAVAAVAVTAAFAGSAAANAAPPQDPPADRSAPAVVIANCNTATSFWHPHPWWVGLPTYNGDANCIMGSGADGSHVQSLQSSLVYCHGQNTGGIDSKYGPRTRAAVIAVQRAAGIPADGVYGPQTRAAMSWVHVTYGGSWYCARAW